ncbi:MULTISPECIES: hypothetical protein [unclassified Pseudomonas]|uniref:hypothetical protein n=1 Tax=unclassified Pseudomonas TaxID=196821 RepID=UPI001781204B|nr:MULTISPECIES: hypothetical protein [unclassified Pseudomonas]MBD8711845.1 hypothetical protein [Pseudomonas sp. CFBP 13715]
MRQHLPGGQTYGRGFAQMRNQQRRQLAFVIGVIEQRTRFLMGMIFEKVIRHLYSSKMTARATKASSQSVKYVGNPKELSSKPLSRRSMG